VQIFHLFAMTNGVAKFAIFVFCHAKLAQLAFALQILTRAAAKAQFFF